MVKRRKLTRCELTHIHPTQVTVGYLAVAEKCKHYGSLSAADLKEALKADPIPTVLGSDGMHFAIDHHHLARALGDAHIEQAYVDVVADFSQLSAEAFWLKMATHQWVHPYDEHGRLHGIDAIPRHFLGLIDDPYRSLAAFVRNAGGYIKTSAPFAEFQWADFFRERVPLWTTPFQLRAATTQAIHLARSPDALILPGFRPLSEHT